MPVGDVNFVSTGDADEDRKIAEEYVTHERRIAEGMCPNGCGPMNRTDENGFDAQCPVCHFGAFSNWREFAALEYAPYRERPGREATI